MGQMTKMSQRKKKLCNCNSENCHLGQLPPRQLSSQGCRGTGTHFHTFNVFICSAMYEKTDSKISLKCCWKSLIFYVCFHIFVALHPCATQTTATRILHFTHHIQAIKFSLAYSVAAHRELIVAEQLRTSWCYNNIASTHFSKSELKRCCHVTYKSKAKVKKCTECKMKGGKGVSWVRGMNVEEFAVKIWKCPDKSTLGTEFRMFVKM